MTSCHTIPFLMLYVEYMRKRVLLLTPVPHIQETVTILITVQRTTGSLKLGKLL
jgi:hypothetical protein